MLCAAREALMDYRLYVPEDFEGLYAIEEVCFQPPFRFGRGYMQRLVRRASAVTWIAEDAGKMAGFAVVEMAKRTDGTLAYIVTIEVLPEFRKCGAGSELLRLIESSAGAANTQTLWLHVDATNAGAIRLYEAHGYRCEGRVENFYAARRAALVYRKGLQAGPTKADSAPPREERERP